MVDGGIKLKVLVLMQLLGQLAGGTERIWKQRTGNCCNAATGKDCSYYN